jgi:hypothetical protein
MSPEMYIKDAAEIEDPCCQCMGTGLINCLVCGGSGRMPDSSLIDADCLKCRGTGQIQCLECEGAGISYFMRFDHKPSHIVPNFGAHGHVG